tara:strand:+ start:732 stop:938 length:207 start_codon:yes stop_codon:yes gene_type:complete
LAVVLIVINQKDSMQIKKQFRKATANADRNTIRINVEKFNPCIPTGILVSASFGGGNKLTATYQRRAS